MRLIDADAIEKAVRKRVYAIEVDDILAEIANTPSIDIVRCQDCKYWVYNFNGCARNPCTEPWYAADFCNYGEREGE